MNRSTIPALFAVAVFLLYSTSFAQVSQDTVKLALPEAEAKFIAANMQLLAAKYNISAVRAGELQAKLWNNPTLSIGQNIYNRGTKRFLDFTKTGNTDISVQQLFLLAGKRDKQIRLAEISTKMSEQNYQSLIRALKHELHTDFYDLYYLQLQLQFYDENIPRLKTTLASLEILYGNRSLLLSELLRLKALLISLESNKLDVLNKITQLENDLAVLLSESRTATAYYVPQPDPSYLTKATLPSISLEQLTDMAMKNRPDLALSELAIAWETHNLSYQKSLAVPDVSLGASYSRSGSYVNDYLGVNVQVDLPFFNRNQGAIEASQNTLEADKLSYAASRLSVQKEVAEAWSKATDAQNYFQSMDQSFLAQYKTLIDGMIASYQQRNLTVIEFTDFYESYRSAIMQLYQLENNRIDAFEDLSYITGDDQVIRAKK